MYCFWAQDMQDNKTTGNWASQCHSITYTVSFQVSIFFSQVMSCHSAGNAIDSGKQKHDEEHHQLMQRVQHLSACWQAMH
jgi:hypothetical protein